MAETAFVLASKSLKFLSAWTHRTVLSLFNAAIGLKLNITAACVLVTFNTGLRIKDVQSFIFNV